MTEALPEQPFLFIGFPVRRRLGQPRFEAARLLLRRLARGDADKPVARRSDRLLLTDGILPVIFHVLSARLTGQA